MKRHSITFGQLCSPKILLGIVFRIETITPPPYLSLSNLYGLEKQFIKNWDNRKVSSNLVSVKIRMPITLTQYLSTDQIYCMELMFKLRSNTLFTLRSLSSRISDKEFREVLLMVLLLHWYVKFIPELSNFPDFKLLVLVFSDKRLF